MQVETGEQRWVHAHPLAPNVNISRTAGVAKPTARAVADAARKSVFVSYGRQPVTGDGGGNSDRGTEAPGSPPGSHGGAVDAERLHRAGPGTAPRFSYSAAAAATAAAAAAEVEAEGQ